MSIVKIPSFGDLELKRLGFLSNKPIFYKIVHKFSCRTIYNIEVPSLSPADEFRRQTALYGVDIMANENKTALLRPVGENTSVNPDARAVARIKRVDGRVTVSLSACGLIARGNGDYYYFLEGNVPPFFRMFDLSYGEFSVLDENKIGATAIVFVTENKAFIDLYGTFSNNGMTEKEAAEYAETYFFGDEIAAGKESFHGETEDKGSGRESSYDDEMIADENYYEFSDVDIKNLRVKDDNGEKNEDAGIFGETRGSRAEKDDEYSGDENEKREGGFFFEKVGADVNEIFKSNPREEDLEKMVFASRWARVTYTDDKFYVVGVIYDNSLPEYICYGVPGNYGEKPEDFRGFCSFIPSSPFRLKSDGYWVMFQNASNGKRL